MWDSRDYLPSGDSNQSRESLPHLLLSGSQLSLRRCPWENSGPVRYVVGEWINIWLHVKINLWIGVKIVELWNCLENYLNLHFPSKMAILWYPPNRLDTSPHINETSGILNVSPAKAIQCTVLTLLDGLLHLIIGVVEQGSVSHWRECILSQHHVQKVQGHRTAGDSLQGNLRCCQPMIPWSILGETLGLWCHITGWKNLQFDQSFHNPSQKKLATTMTVPLV